MHPIGEGRSGREEKSRRKAVGEADIYGDANVYLSAAVIIQYIIIPWRTCIKPVSAFHGAIDRWHTELLVDSKVRFFESEMVRYWMNAPVQEAW